jgi:hypothetical protein
MIEGTKLSSFKRGRPKIQKIENRKIKTAIKPMKEKTPFSYSSN